MISLTFFLLIDGYYHTIVFFYSFDLLELDLFHVEQKYGDRSMIIIQTATDETWAIPQKMWDSWFLNQWDRLGR